MFGIQVAEGKLLDKAKFTLILIINHIIMASPGLVLGVYLINNKKEEGSFI